MQHGKKQLRGNQALRYTGILKFYVPHDGYGYIIIDEGYALDPSVPKELRLERAEVNVAGEHEIALESKILVEFEIRKTGNGKYKAYNMTLPGGIPVPGEMSESSCGCHPQQNTENKIIQCDKKKKACVTKPTIILRYS